MNLKETTSIFGSDAGFMYEHTFTPPPQYYTVLHQLMRLGAELEMDLSNCLSVNDEGRLILTVTVPQEHAEEVRAILERVFEHPVE